MNPPPPEPIPVCCNTLPCPVEASRAAQHRPRCPGRGAGLGQVGGWGGGACLTPKSDAHINPPPQQPQNLLLRALLSQRGQQSRPAPFQGRWERSWGQASVWLGGAHTPPPKSDAHINTPPLPTPKPAATNSPVPEEPAEPPSTFPGLLVEELGSGKWVAEWGGAHTSLPSPTPT